MLDAWKALTSSRGFAAILYAWIFPSAVFVAAVWLFVLPELHRFPVALNFSTLPPSRQLVWLLGPATILGVLLSSISMQLSRFLEGYLFWPTWLQNCRTERQRSKKRRFTKVYKDRCDDPAMPAWKTGLAAERVRRFPEDDAHIAPTRYGNALRALETYGVGRFEFDSQLMWSELLSVAPDKLVEQVHDAADATNFFVAFVALGVAFGLTTLAAGLFEGWQLYMYWRTVAGFAVSVVAYVLAVLSVDNWRNEVQALVNLGRMKLAEQMGLTIPETIEQEREMWLAVRSFVLNGGEEDRQNLDRFRKPPRPVRGSAPRAIRLPKRSRPRAD